MSETELGTLALHLEPARTDAHREASRRDYMLESWSIDSLDQSMAPFRDRLRCTATGETRESMT